MPKIIITNRQLLLPITFQTEFQLRTNTPAEGTSSIPDNVISFEEIKAQVKKAENSKLHEKIQIFAKTLDW